MMHGRKNIKSRYYILLSESFENIIFLEEQMAWLKRVLNVTDCEMYVQKLWTHTQFFECRKTHAVSYSMHRTSNCGIS